MRGEPLERVTFAEVTAFAGLGAAFGGATIPAAVVLYTVLESGPSVLLGLFLAMAFGVVVSIFTAFPLGVLIGWPVFRFLGRSGLHGAAVGVACAILLSMLVMPLGSPAEDLTLGLDAWLSLALFYANGAFAGWVGFRFAFP